MSPVATQRSPARPPGTERPPRASRPLAPSAPAHAPLVVLQRAVGNQALQQALRAESVQRQSAIPVTGPGDDLEREADRVADAVMRMPAAPGPPALEREDDEERMAPQPVLARHPATATPTVSPRLASGIRAQQGSGRPLPASERAFFEPRIGRDLGAVRVHDDSHSAHAARELDAHAFTHGQDVFFAEGRYQPGTEAGRRLLAHELTHTLQQSRDSAARRAIQRNGTTPAPPSPAATPPATTSTPPPGTSAPAGAGGGGVGDPTTGVVHKTATPRRIDLPSVGIPGFKKTPPFGRWVGGANPYVPTATRPLQRRGPYVRGAPRQIDVWRRELNLGECERALGHLISQGTGPAPVSPTGPVAFSAPSRTSGGTRRIAGPTVAQAARDLMIPTWGRGGAHVSYQVDHMRELQLANWRDDDWANHRENFALLEASINASSGSTILGAIERAVKTFASQGAPAALLEAGVTTAPSGAAAATAAPAGGATPTSTPAPAPTTAPTTTPTTTTPSGGSATATAAAAAPPSPYATPAAVPDTVTRGLLNNWYFRFLGTTDLDPPGLVGDNYWTVEEIEAGVHLTPHVTVANPADFGVPGTLFVFTRPLSGEGQAFNSPSDSVTNPATRAWLKPYTIASAAFNTANTAEGQRIGSLMLFVPPHHPVWAPMPRWELPVLSAGGQYTTGYIDIQALFNASLNLQKKGLSPIRLNELDVIPGAGLVASGAVLPDIQPLQNVAPEWELRGDEFTLYKEFSTGDIAVPAPFSVSNSSLTLFASTRRGLGATGRVDFGIQRIATGSVTAEASTAGGFSFDGRLAFDPRLFDGDVSIFYRDRQWGGRGTLRIPQGRVPGIRTATVTVGYQAGRMDATGTATLTIPGVREGTLTLSYSEAEGFAIGGGFVLSDDVPGIHSGRVDANVREKPDGSGYSVRASGTAVPAIPGVESTLTISYDDGAFTIQGSASYTRGIVSGQLELGATNRPVDPQGNPVPTAPPTERLTAFGRGSATVRLTPWLQGTVGLRLLGNGEVELAGEIGLPATVEVFPGQQYTRNIITIGLDIPIVGVAAFGQRIGIFATIQGGLDFSAGIGPGQLRQMRLGITYNPAHEDQTHVDGDAQLVVPAHAGLRLFVRGGIGAGIPVVSATAGLEIGGALGLEGAAEAGVHIDWRPGTGLTLDATGAIYVEPKFKFDVNGFVLVEASAFGLRYEFYNQRWQLAAFEYGSGLRLGITFPVHYREGEPFDLDWSQVQFQIPDVDPQQVLAGLIGQIA